MLPEMTFGGITGAANLTYNKVFPLRQMIQNYSLTDSVTKVYQSHTFKAGIDYHWNVAKQGDSATFAGNFNFGQNATNPLDANWAYANALLGNFYSYSESTTRPRQQDYARAFEWFIQDTWKVSNKLTLDYGVRFTIRWPDWVPTNRASAFVPSRYDPAKKVTLFRPVLDPQGKRVGMNPSTGELVPAVLIGAIVPNSGDVVNGMVLGTDATYPRGFTKNRGVQPGPRFGFAYDPAADGKMAIRGGFGLSTFAGDDSIMYNMVLNPPTQFNPAIYYNNVTTFMNAGSYLFPVSVYGLPLSGENQTFYSFSLGVQRNIGLGTVLDVAYVGNRGRHLQQTQDVNMLPYGTRFLPGSLDATTNRPLPDNFLRPRIGYGAQTIRQTGGNSSYDSLQVRGSRRFSKGLELEANYTWSSTMDYGTTQPMYMPRSWNHEKAEMDHPNALKLAWLWELPKLGARGNNGAAWKAASAALDGWEISGYANFISGMPMPVRFTLSDGADLTGGGDGQRILVLNNPMLPKSERTFYRYFDTSAFARPARGSLGNAALTVFRGPGSNSWDVGIRRVFQIKEKARLELRMDSYNFFNHSQFWNVDYNARFDATGKQINQSFGQISGSRAPRRLQLGLRVSF